MEELVLDLILWFKQFSYLGVVLSLTIEFVPAEIVLPLVGFWVYNGDLNLYLAILAGSIGGTLGPLTLYALGRFGGRPFIRKYGKYFFIKEKHLEKSDLFFAKYGNVIAFSGRFIPGVRTLISIPCGISKMNVWLFSIYTFLAMLPITAFYVYLGTIFGANWQKVGPYAEKYLTFALVGILIFLSFYIAIKFYRKKK